MTDDKSNKPQAIQAAFEPLHVEVVMLHVRRELYRDLFMHSSRRVELLNHWADHAFAHIQWMMFDYLALNVVRLTDPAKTGAYENLTFARLEQVVREHCPAELSTFVTAKVNELHALVAPLRVHRHKRIAHADLKVALDGSLLDEHGITYDHVDQGLALMGEVLYQVNLVYDRSHLDYESIISQGSGASAIIYALKLAGRYDELEKEQKIDWCLRNGGRWNEA